MKNYILALFLCFVIIVVTYFVSDTKINVVKIKKVTSDNICSVSDMYEENDKYVIKAYYPITGIDELDKYVDECYKNIIKQFKEQVEGLELLQENKKFSLDINFNNYECKNYVSFLISYSLDLGGAHLDSNITTINYNKKNKVLVDINNLISTQNNILEIFSKCSYDDLKNKINTITEEELKKGTEAKKNNFQYFVFSNEGIILFFPNYSIVPYYLGNFEVVVGYDKLTLD